MARKTTQPVTRRHKPEPPAPASNNGMVGLGGLAMILLTNYQAEIKKVLDIVLGFIK